MKRLFTPLFLIGLVDLMSCGRSIINKPLQIPYSPGTDSGVSSTNKSISSFVVTAAANPGIISNDVHGSIFFDTIRIVFDRGTDLSSLVPTIGIVGKSVSPASNVAENFDSTLVYTVTATDNSVLYYVVSPSFK